MDQGLCTGGDRLPVNKRIVILAMGPSVSLLTTVICFVLLKTIGPDERQTVVLVTLMTIGGMITLWTGIPRGRFSSASFGGGRNNDAMQVMQLWTTRNLPAAYWEVWAKFQAKDYTTATELVEQMIGEEHPPVIIYRQAFTVHLHAGNYERAGTVLELIRSQCRFSVNDEINDGCHKIMIGRYRHAITIFTELLRTNFNHYLILNNMGYALIAAGEPDKALPYLDRGLMLEPRFSELHANRAWAMMELGRWEEGLANAQQALKRNLSSADTYRVLGLYAQEKGQFQEAREHFLKARALNPNVQFVDEKLVELEHRLQTI